MHSVTGKNGTFIARGDSTGWVNRLVPGWGEEYVGGYVSYSDAVDMANFFANREHDRQSYVEYERSLSI